MAKKKSTITTPPKFKKVVTIPVSELEEGCVYLTHTKDLIKIKTINNETERIHFANLTDQCDQWSIFKHHIIVEKIR